MRRNSSMSSLIKCILFLVFYVQAALYGSAGNSDDSARIGASNIICIFINQSDSTGSLCRHRSFLQVAAAVALAAVSMAPPAHAQRADAGDWDRHLDGEPAA